MVQNIHNECCEMLASFSEICFSLPSTWIRIWNLGQIHLKKKKKILENWRVKIWKDNLGPIFEHTLMHTLTWKSWPFFSLPLIHDHNNNNALERKQLPKDITEVPNFNRMIIWVMSLHAPCIMAITLLHYVMCVGGGNSIKINTVNKWKAFTVRKSSFF